MGGACRVVLVGMMGSGKTVVGRLLAARTGWPLHDNDELVLQLFDATPRQILAAHGEARLRAAESEALAMGLEAPPPSIVGAAAGTILDAANRDVVGHAGVVVWLRASADEIERRAMGSEHRPWLDTGGADWIHEAVMARNPLYGSVADLTLDTDFLEPGDVVEEILAHLRDVEACRDSLQPGWARARPARPAHTSDVPWDQLHKHDEGSDRAACLIFTTSRSRRARATARRALPATASWWVSRRWR